MIKQSGNYILERVFSPLKAPRSVRVNIQRLKYSIRHQHMYTVRCIRCNFTQVCDMYRSSSKIDILNTGEDGQNVTYRTYCQQPILSRRMYTVLFVLSCTVLYCPVLSCPVVNCHVPSNFCSILPCRALYFPIRSFSILSLSHLGLSNPVSDCPILS